jgi:hypothetical protein
MRRIVAALAVAFLLTSCAQVTQTGPRAAVHPAWQSNLGILIAQLRSDVALTSLAGGTLASAKSALTSDSDLYALLVAYDDLGVCRGMVASAASVESDTRAVPVANALASACRHLERAAGLFTRATKKSDPRALLDAATEARRASPSLVRAALALERAKRKVPTPGTRA